MVDSERSDQELLRLMNAGDENAFVELYRRRQGAVFRFALNMSGSRSMAEDVTQEVFMALMSADNYNAELGSLSAYLYGIARNCVLRQIERDRRYVPLGDSSDSDSADDEVTAEGDPLGDLTRIETVETVRRCVLALPSHYREVVVLCDLHEMSYVEASKVLGCALGTVRSRLSRARGLLVNKLRSGGEKGSQVANPAGCLV
jgi:RNA polymerase sigma-70 factor (ECF subfamily)